MTDIETTKAAIAALPDNVGIVSVEAPFRILTSAGSGLMQSIGSESGKSLKALVADHDRLEERLHKCDGMANEINILTAENAKLKKDVEYAENMAPLRMEKLNQLIHYRNETNRLVAENAELIAALEHYANPKTHRFIDFTGRVVFEYPENAEEAQAALDKVKGERND